MRAAHALRLVPATIAPAPATKPARFVPWGPLAEPVMPADTDLRIRAQSILTPAPKGGACPPLTLAQAQDVLAWYQPAAT